MMRGLLAAMLLLGGMGAAEAEVPAPKPIRPRRRAVREGPIDCVCPTCKAAAGHDCNRATLGRYRYHKARVDAVEGGQP